MYVLCDTCSVLMLIRIVPEMFTNPEYECTTILDVKNELFQTAKFKDKFPWRYDYKSKIKYLSYTKEQSNNINTAVNNITNLTEIIPNERTGKYFELSKIDKKIIACVIELEYELSSVDRDLNDFVEQQTDKKSIKPLALINIWLEKDLLNWDKEKQSYIRDWDLQNEAPQDKNDIKKFESFSGYNYCGS